MATPCFTPQSTIWQRKRPAQRGRWPRSIRKTGYARWISKLEFSSERMQYLLVHYLMGHNPAPRNEEESSFLADVAEERKNLKGKKGLVIEIPFEW